MADKGLQIVSGKEFVRSSGKLPKEIKAKLVKTTNSLFDDVPALGAHLEKIQCADDDIYSLRIDNCYRLILKHPNKGNAVFLLYVDKHDEAYEWAKRHCTSVNTATGGIQTSVHLTNTIVEENGEFKVNPKLSVLSDDDMKLFEIPQEYWNQLRTQIFTPKQLVGYKSILSYETYSILEEMLCGLPLDRALALYKEISAPVEVKPHRNSDMIPMFQNVSDDDLMRLGVPDQYLNLVRAVKMEEELVNLDHVLPEDAMQSLYALRNGETVDSILKLTYSDSTPVKEEDYEAALQNPITKSQFAAVENEEALEALLKYPTAQWRAYLHPSQRRLIERHYGGPARIIGGAGTGKTVVIVHRAKYLTHFCPEGEKVFITSFNKSLVADIDERLNTICTSEERSKIEVLNIDKKTYDVAKSIGIRIKYGRDIENIWDAAIGVAEIDPDKYSKAFIMDEWTDVIQAQQLKTKEAYCKAQRVGRSKRLDSASREEIWKVFEVYKKICETKKIVDVDWAQNQCAEACTANPNLCHYYSILVDECQDLRAPAYRFLRSIAGEQRPDDIFFSGDSRQRIYKGRASLSQCGIVINNRSNTLKLNYRTTAEIYGSAIKVQQEYQYDDLDGKTVDQDLCTCIFHGEKPVMRSFENESAELDALVDSIRQKVQSGIPEQEICVLVRTRRMIGKCMKKLASSGFRVLELSNMQNDDLQIPGVRIATMHRVKGMEYSCVYIPFMTNTYMPYQEELSKAEDEADQQDIIKKEANLLSVAMTRARQFVWLSYSGEPSQYLKKIG